MSAPYRPPPGFPSPPAGDVQVRTGQGPYTGAPHGTPPAMPTSARVAIGLAALAFGAERLAYSGSRLLTYSISAEVGTPTLPILRATAIVGMLGLLIGAGLAYAIGSRLTGLLGALIAAVGAGVSLISPSLGALALISFGCGVFRPAPFGVVLEEVPGSPARFRRVAASLAVVYLAVDASGLLSSLFSVARSNGGVGLAFAIVAALLAVVAGLFGALLFMGPRRHLQPPETCVELVRGGDDAPYRGAPSVQRAPAPALPLGLLGALFGAYALEVVCQAVSHVSASARGAFGSIGSFGLSLSVLRVETLSGIGITVALAVVFALTETRIRSVHLFGAGMALHALGALLRIPVAGFYALALPLGLVARAGQTLAIVAGLAAFASPFPKRAAPLAVAAWYLMSTALGFILGFAPSGGWLVAGLAASCALGAATLLLVFGARLQPELDS